MRKIGVIGGTGVENPELMQGFEQKVISTPYGDALCNVGEMFGNQVVFVSRHGVEHNMPPHKVNYRANIWALKSLGTEEIFATTAVGSLNPKMKPGHFVVCSNMLDFSKTSIHTFYDTPERGVVHINFTEPYCECLRKKACKCLKKLGLKYHKQGVYGCNYDAMEADYYGYRDLINKKALCTSNSNGVGLLDMYVYIEGWDKCLDNSGIGYRYNLNLNFTI